MFCRKCGSKINDTDLYCQICGTPTGQVEPPAVHAEEAEGKEEIIFNPPYENYRLHHADRELRFSGEEAFTQEKVDLAESPSENRMKEADKTRENNAGGPSEEKEACAGNPSGKNSEFTWNVHQFPKSGQKTEDIEFNWNMEAFSQPEQQEAAAASFEEALFREIKEDSSRVKEQNIDRFFTFSRKNEEFQKLLDREYEKLNMQSEPEEDHFIEQSETAQEHAETFEPKEIIAEADRFSEMDQAKTPFFGEELIRDNESIRRKLEPSDQDEELEPEQEKNQEPEQEKNQEPEQDLISEPEEAATASQAGDLPDQPEETAQEGPAEEAADQPEKAADSTEEAPVPADETASRLSQLFTPLEEEEAKAHKKSAGQIALIILAVILAIEIAILGIRYFAPNSMAAGIINQTQTQIFHTVSDWAYGIKDLFSGKDASEDKAAASEDNDQNAVEKNTRNGEPAKDQDKTGSSPVIPDPNPASDKNALVASQLGNNKNIEQVKANETLAYQKDRDYGLTDVNNSKPIINNIWQAPENGAPVYYDQAVVGTVISFDSQWIDYVNGGGKGVLDLLKKDSPAYRKTASFSKIGKIEEAFKLLEIGEIRQGAKGFYVWTHEELQVTENGKTAVTKYNWIYYLEPVDGKMKIVNYFKF